MKIIYSLKKIIYLMLISLSTIVYIDNVHADDSLMDLLKTRNYQYIEQLISSGADVNQTDNKGQTPLIIASINRQPVRIIDLLIKQGADVFAVDDSGRNALMYTSQYTPYPDTIRLIIKKALENFDDIEDFTNWINYTDLNGNSAIFYAALNYRDVQGILLLHTAQAKINVFNNEGDTPLSYAISSASDNNVIELIKLGADISLKRNDGENILIILAKTKSSNPDLINILVEKGADIHYKNEQIYSFNPIISASIYNSPELIEALLKKDADPNSKDSRGISTLMYAVMYNPNPEDAVRILLKYGADRNYKFGEHSIVDIVEGNQVLSEEDKEAIISLLK